MYNPPITQHQLFGYAVEYFGSDIFDGRPTKRVTRMKRIWCAYAISEADMTYEEAGKFVHLHYSSVSYHKNKHLEEYFNNTSYRTQYDNFTSFINSKINS